MKRAGKSHLRSSWAGASTLKTRLKMTRFFFFLAASGKPGSCGKTSPGRERRELFHWEKVIFYFFFFRRSHLGARSVFCPVLALDHGQVCHLKEMSQRSRGLAEGMQGLNSRSCAGVRAGMELCRKEHLRPAGISDLYAFFFFFSLKQIPFFRK